MQMPKRGCPGGRHTGTEARKNSQTSPWKEQSSVPSIVSMATTPENAEMLIDPLREVTLAPLGRNGIMNLLCGPPHIPGMREDKWTIRLGEGKHKIELEEGPGRGLRLWQLKVNQSVKQTIIGGPHIEGNTRNVQMNYAREANDLPMTSYLVD